MIVYAVRTNPMNANPYTLQPLRHIPSNYELYRYVDPVTHTVCWSRMPPPTKSDRRC